MQNIINLSNVNFSLIEANRLFDEETRFDRLKKLTEFPNTQAYINKYIFAACDGSHYIWNGSEFTYYTLENLTNIYLKRLNKDVKQWYLTGNCNIYTLVAEIGKPRIFDNKINLAEEFKHINKPYSEFSKESVALVNRMLLFIREVFCSNDEQFKYFIKILASIAHGHKVETCVYLKGEEGIGKSTLIEFFTQYVIGMKLSYKATTSCLTGDFNKQLLGKLVVYFEELPTFTANQWEGVSSKIKDMVTGSTIQLRDLFEKAIVVKNSMTIFINTNVNAIKSSEGRRYFILDLDNLYKGNKEYFANLKEACFNDDCGSAFFSYLLNCIDITNFNRETMPDTNNKLNAIADRLHPVYQYIKATYFKKTGSSENHKNLFCKVSVFYKDFCEYHELKGGKSMTKNTVNDMMKSVGIIEYKSNGFPTYKKKYEELEKIALANHWIGTLDEIILDAVADNSIKEIVPNQLPNNYMFDELEPLAINYDNIHPSVLADLANTKKINIEQEFKISQLEKQLLELKKLYNGSVSFITKPEQKPEPKQKKTIVKPVKQETKQSVLEVFDLENDPEVSPLSSPIKSSIKNRKNINNMFDMI